MPRASAARLVAADRQMPEHAERDLAIDEIHERLDLFGGCPFDDDAHRERAPEHAHRVSLGAAVGARRELILRMQVQLRRRPSAFGSRIADENAAALADGAEGFSGWVVLAYVTLHEVRVCHVVPRRTLHARKHVAERPAHARTGEQRATALHEYRAVGA